MPLLLSVFAVIGGLVVCRFLANLVSTLVDTLLPLGPRVDDYKNFRSDKTKNWAVVTGATAGIGEEFARQLAAAGFSIGLVSRNPEKLHQTAEELKAKYPGVETAEFALDAVTAKERDYEQLAKWAKELGRVTVLVNNVGQSHEMPVPFLETTEEEIGRIIQINNIATLAITKAVLPEIKESIQQKRAKRGLVLTMGSFAGLTPTPLLATYAGSKAFLQAWSSALAAEVEPLNIDAQFVLSYLVTSNMSKVRRTSMLIPSPQAFVKSTLGCIGRRGGANERAYTMTPYWSHALMHYAIESTLGVYSQIVARVNLSMHRDIRRRALRKKAKTQ